MKKLWDAEPVVLALVLPALAALVAGAALYANGATTGGGTTGAAGAVAAILSLLVRNKVFSPVTAERMGVDASNAATVLTEVRNTRSSINAVQAALPRRTGHEGMAAIAPWPEPEPDNAGLSDNAPILPVKTLPPVPSNPDPGSADDTPPTFGSYSGPSGSVQSLPGGTT